MEFTAQQMDALQEMVSVGCGQALSSPRRPRPDRPGHQDGGDDEQARAMAEQLQSDTNDALENLRDLARGIYPPLLADQGLTAALEAQARKSTVPVTIDADGVDRYSPEVESAVYFSCLESLQNVAKYAAAATASIRLSTSNDSLRFSVEDDGVGFDTSATRFGTGLQGIADRLAALGGDLNVTSAIGAGTKVVGSIPVTGQQPTTPRRLD